VTEAPRVTIAGGGLAGLTAALRLAERGCRVKLYEQKTWLGGNLASRPTADGARVDVYPHMYLEWYNNFWRLIGDVTDVERDELFLPLNTVKQLRRGEYPRFHGLTNMYSPWYMLRNLFSGVGRPADMYLFGYATIDLLAERCNPTMLPNDVTVGGFLDGRPYMTQRAAEAVNNFIVMIWAIPSYQASAVGYREYLEYCMARPTPAYWLARGSAYDQVIAPLSAALERHGVEIVPSVQVTGVSCRRGRVEEIELQKVRYQERSEKWVGDGRRFTEDVDELILAVPPAALSRLVRSGRQGRRIVEAAPELAGLSRLHAAAIPMLNVYFTRKLRGIPVEPVGLFGSMLGLAFTDISQTWDDTPGFEGHSVLALSASDPFGLPGTGPHDDGMAILREAAEYLKFDAGAEWGASPDIDWERTRYQTNEDALLFVNDAGTEDARPQATCEEIHNLFFAGDFCRNRIGMTTMESAVTTGLEAAAALVKRRGLGTPVEIVEPRSRAGLPYVWLRYAWAPYAWYAKAWSTGGDYLCRLARHLRDS